MQSINELKQRENMRLLPAIWNSVPPYLQPGTLTLNLAIITLAGWLVLCWDWQPFINTKVTVPSKEQPCYQDQCTNHYTKHSSSNSAQCDY